MSAAFTYQDDRFSVNHPHACSAWRLAMLLCVNNVVGRLQISMKSRKSARGRDNSLLTGFFISIFIVALRSTRYIMVSFISD